MNQKTKCPNCQTIYPLPQSKLNDDKARATCKKCQTPFYVNQHLIDTNPPKAKAAQSQNNRTNTAKSRPKKPIASDGLIHDDMETQKDNDDFAILDDELDSFMQQGGSITPTATAAIAKDSGQQTVADNDEAWLDDLLKNDDSPNIPVAVASKPDDDLSDIFGEDIISAIPAENIEESPEVIRQKMQARLANKSPTQEQLIKQRSTGYYVLWSVGIVLMILLAAAQYAIFNRHAIAKNPKYASVISALCPACYIPAADPTAFSTEYTLQKGQADFTTDMIVAIANHSPTAQIFPNLKITIQGQQGVIGELALAPSEYLEVSQLESGSGQHTRFMLTLDLALSEIEVITIEPFY